MKRNRRITGGAASVIILVASCGMMLGLIKTRPRPAQSPDRQDITPVEVLRVTPTLLDAPIVGYGTVRPTRQVRIVAEVNGRITRTHPRLAAGYVIPKGELLLAIDSREHESKIQQVEAEIRRLQAQLARHKQERVNLSRRLELANRQAELLSKSVEREQHLLQRESGTAPEVEASQQRLLAQQDAVATYEGQLAVMPTVIDETTALLTIKQAQLAEAKLNLERTRVYCPFNARVEQASATTSQFVTIGTPLATLTDVATLEVAVPVEPQELLWLDEQALAGSEAVPGARITWLSEKEQRSWPGNISRTERFDELTRSAHVVVEMHDLPAPTYPGFKDTPYVGMFCRVDLPTRALTDAVVLPRAAVNEGRFVYIYEPSATHEDQGRLATRNVNILRRIGEDVLVSFAGAATGAAGSANKLDAGDLVVVSVLARPVEGMALSLAEISEPAPNPRRSSPPSAADDPVVIVTQED